MTIRPAAMPAFFQEGYMKTETAGLIIYLTLSFAIPHAVWTALGVHYGTTPYMIVSAALMWVPALSLIPVRLITKKKVMKLSLKAGIKGNAGTYLLAWFIPLLAAISGAFLFFLLNPSAFTYDLIRETEINPILLPALIIPSSLFNMLFAAGEEAGWRGYLYPLLKERLGRTGAVAATGIIWGLWHTPINMQGHNYGLAYPGYPWAGIAAMCLFCISAGAWCSYLAERTGSLWAPSLFHGAVNAATGTGILFMVPGTPMLFGPALSGIIPSLVLLLILIIICYFHGWNHSRIR